jgi:hypothetical protein
MSSSRQRYLNSRLNHTDNGKLAERRVTTVLKITAQVNENTHLRSNTKQHLIHEHQLMNIGECPMKVLAHVTTTPIKRSPCRRTRANLLRLGQSFGCESLAVPSARRMSLRHRNKFHHLLIARTAMYSVACPIPLRVLSAKSCGVEGALSSSSASGKACLLELPCTGGGEDTRDSLLA